MNENVLPAPLRLGSNMNRRDFLQVGYLGVVGLGLGDLLRNEGRAASAKRSRPAKAQSVIQIYLPGGIAHQEFVDPKPGAPIEYRGEMDSIRTAIPGIRFNELMADTAKIADKISVIRSMTHTEAAHERGTHNMLTGYRPSAAIIYPSIGSIVSHKLGTKNELPAYVCIPRPATEYSGSGYLSSAHGPFSVGSDPARRTFKVRDLNLPPSVNEARFNNRKSMLEVVDQHFKQLEDADEIASMDSFYSRAYSMLSSQAAREAFDLSKESNSVRGQYGRYGAGPRLLLARRLVEAGVRFVSLSYGAWDTHTYHFRTTRRILPSFDKALAAMINDLDERGMLDSTLVIVCSEFGRTPKVNAGAGRDHWPRVFSTILAGGGIKRGSIYGASDAIAAEPDRDPVSPEDFAMTIYNQLGIDARQDLIAPGDRPLKIVSGGEVIKDLLG